MAVSPDSEPGSLSPCRIPRLRPRKALERNPVVLPVTKFPSCRRAGVPARLNRLQSHAKGQVLGAPRPKAGEDARAPPTFPLALSGARYLRRQTVANLSLASDVLSLGSSEAVHVLGRGTPLDRTAARIVPHRASIEGT